MAVSRATVCVAGCGPAGAMLGRLLARAGVKVVMLEKHADFRGDTVHPLTIEVLAELGLADRFLALPHHQVPAIGFVRDGRRVQVADFGGLGLRYPVHRVRAAAGPAQPAGHRGRVVPKPPPAHAGQRPRRAAVDGRVAGARYAARTATTRYVAYMISKSGHDRLRRAGIQQLRDDVANLLTEPLRRALRGGAPPDLSTIARLPVLSRPLSRPIGVGIRPEHVRVPARINPRTEP